MAVVGAAVVESQSLEGERWKKTLSSFWPI